MVSENHVIHSGLLGKSGMPLIGRVFSHVTNTRRQDLIGGNGGFRGEICPFEIMQKMSRIEVHQWAHSRR